MNCEFLNSFLPYVRGSCAGIGWRDTVNQTTILKSLPPLFVGTDADNPGNDRVPAAYGAGTETAPCGRYEGQ